MKSTIESALIALLKTPAIAEELRKRLVNRDLSITIDGKEFHILKKDLSKVDLDQLKIENYDLRQALTNILTSMKYRNLELNPELQKAVKDAEKLL